MQMEGLSEKNAEEEKAAKRRRSSILKLPKVRSPFTEVDVGLQSDVTLSKSVRRVSFASSNFVKPFVADPDRNTIWDTTYEEEINHTDSTQSSQEHTSTKTHSLSLSAVNNPVNLTNVEMCETEVNKLFVNEENIPVVFNRISIIDYAKQMASNSVIPLYDAAVHRNFHETNMQLSPMDFTCQILEHDQVCDMELTEISISDETNKCTKSYTTDMEFTCQVPQPNRDFDKLSQSNHCQIPQKVSNAPGTTDTKFCRQIPQREKIGDRGVSYCQNPQTQAPDFDKLSTTEGSFNMELTCQIPQRENLGVLSKIGDNRSVTCQIPHSREAQDCDKLTKTEKSINTKLTCQNPQRDNLLCQIPKTDRDHLLSKVGVTDIIRQSYDVTKTEKPCNMDLTSCQIRRGSMDMEFTCQIPNKQSEITQDLEMTNNIEMSTIAGCQISRGAADMEFTCQVPQREETDVLSKTTEMEFTCQIPNKQSEITQDLEMTNNIGTVGNLDASCQIPTKEMSKVASDTRISCQVPQREEIDVLSKTAEMEFTCQIPTKEMSKVASDTRFSCQVPQRKEIDVLSKTAEMEFTCQIPTKEMSKVASDTRFSCQIPQREELDVLSKTTEMEFTCQIPTKDMSKVASDTRFSCQVPQREEIDVLSKTTEMEFTCQIPNKRSEITQDLETTNNIGTVGNLDASCQIPTKEMSKVASDTRFSCQIPQRVASSKTTKMEFACQIPQTDKKHALLSNVGHSLDMTETEKPLNMDVTRQTPRGAVDMEFTCQIPNKPSEMGDEHVLSKTGSQIRQQHEGNVTRQAGVDNTNCQMSKVQVEGPSCQEPQLDETEYMEVSYAMASTIELSELMQTDKSCRTPREHQAEVIENSTATPKSPFRASKFQVKPSWIRLDTTNDNLEQSLVKNKCDVVFSQKMPNLPTDNSFCCFKTPEASFQMNRLDISPGVDDTQQLIHCTYTKIAPYSFIGAKSADPSGIKIDLEKTDRVSNANLVLDSSAEASYVDCAVRDISKSSSEVSYVDVQNKLSTVNDTYVLKGKTPLGAFQDFDGTLLDEQEEPEQMTNISLTGVADRVAKKIDFTPRLRKETCEKKNTSRRKDLIEKIQEQRAKIIYFLKNFKFDPIPIPEELTVTEKTIESEPVENKCADIVLTLEEKIQKHHEESQKLWRLETSDGDLYSFSSFFGALLFSAQVDPTDGRVRGIAIKNKLADDAHTIHMFLVRQLSIKLEEKQIRAAIGDQYDILSLLDYVEMVMLQLVSLIDDFIDCDILTLERDFTAKFTIINPDLLLHCEISVDVSDLDNIDCESLKVCSKTEEINDREFKNYVRSCRKGCNFFKDFALAMEEYVKVKEKRKKVDKSN